VDVVGAVDMSTLESTLAQVTVVYSYVVMSENVFEQSVGLKLLFLSIESTRFSGVIIPSQFGRMRLQHTQIARS
jgi:hypothetical protein